MTYLGESWFPLMELPEMNALGGIAAMIGKRFWVADSNEGSFSDVLKDILVMEIEQRLSIV